MPPVLLVVALSLVTSPLALPAPASTRLQFPAVDRTWIGPEYYANRLQDWRMRDGRLEAIQGSTAKPMRTVHLLTRSLSSAAGTVSMSVRTGPLAVVPPAAGLADTTVRRVEALAHTWSGFLVGAGSDRVDHRISALVHHWPGPDGGLIVAVDGTGRIVVRDHSNAEGPGRPAPDLPLTAWPLIAPTTSTISGTSRDLVLRMAAAPSGGGRYRMWVEARDAASDRIMARAEYHDLPAHHFDGTVAVVSHHSLTLDGPGYWFRDWTLDGSKVQEHADRAFGPIMGTLYSLSRGVLRLTAQFGPLGADDERTAHLEVWRGDSWVTVSTASIVADSWTAHFRVAGWDGTRETPYRVVYHLRQDATSATEHHYAGTVRREPTDRSTLVLGAINCVHPNAAGSGAWNSSGFWHPHSDIVHAMQHHDPDLLFFSGDQIYEGAPFGVVRAPQEEAILDYLNHWYLWVWAFRDLTRDRPALVIPDDHDMFQGNIWGAGGIVAEGPLRPVADNGGYLMSARWVNAVHRTQTWSLPDPVDPTPIAQGITAYHTSLEYAGISFAIVADRMFKSAPAVLLPEAQVVNGWSQNAGFDPRQQADIPGAVLLGERQMAFLDRWAADWEGGTWMKVLLSQTLFANLATIPVTATSGAAIPSLRHAEPDEYIEGDKKAADFDSNGWPQSERNRVLATIRKAFALHIGGDQHLGSVVRYGVDAFNDAGYAFIVPAAANLWPRRWFPPEAGANRQPGQPRYAGEHFDGFGNRMTVIAASNPVKSYHQPEALYDRAPGYGIVRFERATRNITLEAWPRWVDPSGPDPRQYFGWPVSFHQFDNYAREAIAHLPELQFSGMAEPVVQVIAEEGGAVVYTVRIAGARFTPPVFAPGGTYTLVVGEPGTERTRTIRGVRPAPLGAAIRVEF